MRATKELFTALKHITFDGALAHEAKRRYGERFWSGADAIVAEDTLLAPNKPTLVEGVGFYRLKPEGGLEFDDPATEVPVLLTPDTIPRLAALKFLPNDFVMPTPVQMLPVAYEEGLQPFLLTSTKSRVAHIGAEASDMQHIPGWVWRRLAWGKSTVTPIRVNNYSARPLLLEKGTPLFRFFSPLLSTPLKGEALVRACMLGEVRIEGKMGETWRWISRDPDDPYGLERPEHIFGIEVKLKPELRWLPHSDKPLRMRGFAGANYRQKIDALLEPAPDTDQSLLCISETYRLRLGPQLAGYLSLWGSGISRQINSRVLDPESNWPIRVEELISPRMARQIADDRYMEFYLHRNNAIV